jgi:uncharacterized membrane protein YfcA
MSIEYILILLGTGLFSGLGSGLLGIGGGLIMTPMQYAVFSHMGIATDVATKLAIGTSLLVILPTAMVGAWSHSKEGVVYWRAAIIMGFCSLLGGFVGATAAAYIASKILRIAFGVVALGASARMFSGGLPSAGEVPRSNVWLWIAIAFPVGVITGLLGIGGGVVVVPVMVMVLQFSMHMAVASSLAMMILTSIGGCAGYIWHGLGVSGLPPWSLGYIDLPVWGLLSVSSIIMARVGAVVGHKMPAKQLKFIFAIVLLYMGLRMVGLFEWLGLPL